MRPCSSYLFIHLSKMYCSPTALQRCHSEPVTVSPAWESALSFVGKRIAAPVCTPRALASRRGLARNDKVRRGRRPAVERSGTNALGGATSRQRGRAVIPSQCSHWRGNPSPRRGDAHVHPPLFDKKPPAVYTRLKDAAYIVRRLVTSSKGGGTVCFSCLRFIFWVIRSRYESND